jgi:octaprenyl-diphosphate synthase
MNTDKSKQIADVFCDDLKKVDEIILKFASGKSSLIQEISHYLISSGGKRIRPLLLILSAKMCDENVSNYHNLCAAIELIHTATLLHDDVVDASNTRRGRNTSNAIWDNKASILVGDYLFSTAFQLMVQGGNLRVLDLLSKTSGIMADGEVLQLENSSNIDLSQEKYLDIIFRKTAALFSSATEAGALIADRNEDEILRMKSFGTNFGILFQITDDILDYQASKADFGKDSGDDFFEGKVTLPIIISYKLAKKNDENDAKKIRNLMEKNLISDEKNYENLQEIIFLIHKYQGFNECIKIAEEYKNLASENISVFKNSSYKCYLIDILEYCLDRTAMFLR